MTKRDFIKKSFIGLIGYKGIVSFYSMIHAKATKKSDESISDASIINRAFGHFLDDYKYQ